MNLVTLGFVLAMTAATPTPLQQRVEALASAIEPQVADVPVTRAKQLLRADPMPLLLDVRSPAERAVSIIPGALTELGTQPPGTRVVVYCTVGLRSGIRARQLRAQGFDAVNLRGGILLACARRHPGRSTRQAHAGRACLRSTLGCSARRCQCSLVNQKEPTDAAAAASRKWLARLRAVTSNSLSPRDLMSVKMKPKDKPRPLGT